MEILEKYWYVALGALVLIYFVTRSSGASAPTLQQVGGSDATTLALAQMASANQNAQLDRQYGFASNFLNYNLQSRQVDQIIPLAQIQADAQTKALANQTQLAQLSFILANNQLNQQAAAQSQAINQQASAQKRSDWLSLIASGIGAVFGI